MKRMFAALALLCFALGVEPARASITFDEAFGHEPPWGRIPSRIAWRPDGRAFTYVLASQDNRDPLDVRLYDVASGSSRVLIPALKLGMHGRVPINVVWAPDSRRLVFVEGGALYAYDASTSRRRLLARDASSPQWSPDGRFLAFQRRGDVYVAPSAGGTARRITFGGSPDVLNGDLDWVYPEELGTPQAFSWSPDGRSIAYLHMDDRGVTAFPIVDFLQPDNAVDNERYPLAGERNPKVALHEVNVATLHDLTVYDAGRRDEYLPWFDYVPHSHALTYEVIDRAQQHARVELSSGSHVSTLYATSDAAWVDVIARPAWRPDGGSYWVLSDGTTRSLFFRNPSGSLRQLTRRTRIYGIEALDRRSGDALVSAAYPTRRDTALLRIASTGAESTLTPGAGSHRVSLAPDGSRFTDNASSLNAPPELTLVDTATSKRRTIAARSSALAGAMLVTDMLTVKDRNGILLDATMLKPPNFDPLKRYPVIVYVYGGPESPTTQNRFGGLYSQLLAQAGYIVFSIDGPESQVDSEHNLRSIRENFGPAMLAGQETGAEYLSTLPYVDTRRIGMWGWSYGGYATVYTLEHSQRFAAGVAVAPVTDWHFYDSIYTERYMGLPKDHARAYDRSSDLPGAKSLTQPLLINHGTGDDNVHMANSVTLMQAFITGDRSNVDFAVYPRQLHGIAAFSDQRVLYRRMIDWWLLHMPP